MEEQTVEMKKQEPEEEPVEVSNGGVTLKKVLILASEYRDLVSFHKRKMKHGHQRKLTKKDIAEIEERVSMFTFDERKFAEYHVEAAIARMMEMDAERAQKKFEAAMAQRSQEPQEKDKEEDSPPALEVVAETPNFLKASQ